MKHEPHLILRPADIKLIGHTSYPDENRNTHFICSISTAGIEEILLRNILRLIGGYSITSKMVHIETAPDGQESVSIDFGTNLLWDIYRGI